MIFTKDISDEEYNMYKKKLEQIYDLCKQCKQKVNSHLQKQDQLIGNCLIKQRTTKNSSQNVMNAKINGNLSGHDTSVLNGNGEHFSNGPIYKAKLPKQSMLNKEKNEENIITDSDFYGNFSSSFKKAYTIAGSMPSFIRKFSQNGYSPKEVKDKTKFNIDSPTPAKKILIPNDDDKMTECSTTKPTNKSTNINSLNIILSDLMVLIAALMVFFSDLSNLINDSDFVNDRIDNQTTIKNDYALFQFLLNFYRYNMTVLFFILLLTIHLSFKRYIFEF